MCSILKRASRGVMMAAVATVLSAGAGCQRMTPPQPDRLSHAPLVVDEAMQKRDWEPQTCYYANGNTIAGGTGYVFRTSDRLPQLWWRIVDPTVATGNILALPGTIWFNPPWKAMAYQGAIIPPTYTAMPEVPPDESR